MKESSLDHQDSMMSTKSIDRHGAPKVTSFFPPTSHLEEDGEVHTYSFTARIWLVLEDPSMGQAAKWMSIIMMLLILMSCVGFIIESMPSSQVIYDPKDHLDAAKYGIPGYADGDKSHECDLVKFKCNLCWDDHDDMAITEGECSRCTSLGSTLEELSTQSVRVCQPQGQPVFTTIEAFCIYCFTLDYILRILCVGSVSPMKWGGDPEKIKSIPAKIYKYATGAMNVIDLVAIMPFWLEMAVGGNVPLGFLRVLRLARVFRIFKLGKYNEGMSLFARTLHASIPALTLLCFFVLIGVVLFGSIIYFVEGGQYTVDPDICPAELNYACFTRENDYNGGSREPTPFISIPFSFYWVMVTMTTVGYGDQFPLTGLGKFITILCMLCGILTLALPITVLGSNFTAEYEKMHGGSEDNEDKESEEKFWEHFASLVATSMTADGDGLDKVNTGSTRARLKSMILEQTTLAAQLEQEQISSNSSSRSLGVRKTNFPEGSTDSVITSLEATIRQLQATVASLKSAGGDMVVEDIISPSNSLSPSPFEANDDGQKLTVMSKYAVQGRMLEPEVTNRVKREPIDLSGEGVLPTYFDIFTPKKLKNKKQFHFSPNITPREDSITAVEKGGEGNALDLDAVEKLVMKEGDESEQMQSNTPTVHLGGHTLDLRSSKAKSKLARLGKSMRWGQSLSAVARSRQMKSHGQTHRQLDFQVVAVSGFDCEDKSILDASKLSFTVAAGASQFETSPKSITGGVIEFGESFTYAVPLSTHSSDIMVKNLEFIAHLGTEVIGTAVVPLSSVCGSNVEYRVSPTGNYYLRTRQTTVIDGHKAVLSGNGRLILKMEWNDTSPKEHKYGTSFAKLLHMGQKWGENIDAKTSYREQPMYPRFDTARGKRKISAHRILVEDAGERFLFEESSRETDDSCIGEIKKFDFPDTLSSTQCSTSPTQSPGRSDTDNSDNGNVTMTTSKMYEKRAKEARDRELRASLIDNFLHNN